VGCSKEGCQRCSKQRPARAQRANEDGTASNGNRPHELTIGVEGDADIVF
jgi:hypothetical protein